MSLLKIQKMLKIKRLERIGSFKRKRSSDCVNTEVDSRGSVLKNLSPNAREVGSDTWSGN